MNENTANAMLRFVDMVESMAIHMLTKGIMAEKECLEVCARCFEVKERIKHDETILK